MVLLPLSARPKQKERVAFRRKMQFVTGSVLTLLLLESIVWLVVRVRSPLVALRKYNHAIFIGCLGGRYGGEELSRGH